ncbi:MAG TPA: PP2C family protein-serine/threonine phosphatase [Acidimicrobiales bacterium]|nr:PP2C family protein-serine/threonine phosphatase [Acidimicrobiales bacterium]
MASYPVLSELLRRANLSAPDLLVADVAGALSQAGCVELALYLVDYEQDVLRRVSLGTELLADGPAEVSVAGTMAGRSFQLQQVVTAQSERGWTAWSPIRERAERIGVLEVVFGQLPEDAVTLCEDVGRLVGHLVRTAHQYTDQLELTRRRQPMSLAAEVQWHLLLPPLAFQSPDVAVAGILEPAYDVAGDAFDYSLNGEDFTFAILDAMGHGLTSSLASALSLTGLRYGRLRGMTLEDIAREIDEALIGQFHGDQFVTGHLVRLDTATGAMQWINAGHPDPFLIRGTSVVAELHAEPCFPLGLGITISEVGNLRLEPGDRVLFYSDGVVEARPAGGMEYGVVRLRDRVERHLADNLIPAEIIRRIVKEVIVHRGGPLADDASLIMIEWLPDNGE